MSQQIKLHEAQLGFALFGRPGWRIALNAAGEALLRAVEPALAQLDDGVRAAAAAASAIPRSRSSCTPRNRSSISPAKGSMRRWPTSRCSATRRFGKAGSRSPA